MLGSIRKTVVAVGAAIVATIVASFGGFTEAEVGTVVTAWVGAILVYLTPNEGGVVEEDREFVGGAE